MTTYIIAIDYDQATYPALQLSVLGEEPRISISDWTPLGKLGGTVSLPALDQSLSGLKQTYKIVDVRVVQKIVGSLKFEIHTYVEELT